MKYYPRILNLLLIFLCFETHAQNAFDSSLADAVSVYKKTIGVNMHLYTGREYIDYDHRVKGNPFFNSTYFADGDVVYDGITYNHVQMFYDLLHDDVVIKNYNDTPLVLVKEKLSSFNYLGNHFINLGADSNLTQFKISGFYEVLYNGNVKLFAKHKKEINTKISTVYTESSYDEKTEYYILNNNTLYAVNTKNSVLDVMKNHKNEMTKYMRQAKIKFRRDPEAAMIKMTEHYDALTTSK